MTQLNSKLKTYLEQNGTFFSYSFTEKNKVFSKKIDTNKKNFNNLINNTNTIYNQFSWLNYKTTFTNNSYHYTTNLITSNYVKGCFHCLFYQNYKTHKNFKKIEKLLFGSQLSDYTDDSKGSLIFFDPYFNQNNNKFEILIYYNKNLDVKLNDLDVNHNINDLLTDLSKKEYFIFQKSNIKKKNKIQNTNK